MNIIFHLGHSNAPHQSALQEALHIATAWYVLIPVFTILITLVVALAIRMVLLQAEGQSTSQKADEQK